LYDNTKLDKLYVESMEKITPSGMFYDRDILGKWVSAEGVIYKDFDKEVHLIDKIPKGEHIERYIGGIDFGFEHYGSMVVIAICTSGNYYLVEEVAEQYKYIEWWIDRAKEFQYKYYNLFFYADSARPEYVQQMKESNINIENANKSVIEGINAVGSLLKQKKLFFIKDKFKKGLEEMYLYCWASGKSGKEEVLKVNDDVMDSLRYCIFSDMREYSTNADDFIIF